MLADPSIAVSALKARPNDLSRDTRTLGGIFENICLRDLLVYSDALYLYGHSSPAGTWDRGRLAGEICRD